MRWVRGGLWGVASLLLLCCLGLAVKSNLPPKPQALLLLHAPAQAAGAHMEGQTDLPVEAEAPVHLNTATHAQLMTLPGIGPALADSILAARAACPFHYVEDLRVVPGIGARRLQALRPFITVDAPRP